MKKILVLLSASVKRFGVSRMQDFYKCIKKNVYGKYFSFACLSGEKSPDAPNFLNVPNLSAKVAFSQDTLTQIKILAHSANIPVSGFLIDNPHAYVWTS